MFETICDLIPRDADYPARARTLDILRRVLDGTLLAANGYEIADPGADYWFMRRWDAQDETWFVPWPLGTTAAPEVDAQRSVRHGLGFVPMVWVRNLPGLSATGDVNDGACTFRA